MGVDIDADAEAMSTMTAGSPLTGPLRHLGSMDAVTGEGLLPDSAHDA